MAHASASVPEPNVMLRQNAPYPGAGALARLSIAVALLLPIALLPLHAQQKQSSNRPIAVDAAGEPLQKLPPLQLPANVVRENDLKFARYGTRELLLDLYRPESGKGPFPGVVFVHGGAWSMGDRSSFGHQAAYLASRGFVCISIDYRLVQEAIYPAALFDTKAAIRWMRANAAKYKIDSDRIAAVGSSSGGQLVTLLGTTGDVRTMEGDGGNQQFSSRVQAVVAFYPPTDLVSLAAQARPENPGAAPPAISKFLGGTLQQIPETYVEASAVAHVSKDAPPILFLHGDADTTIPIEQSLEMQRALRAVGVRAELYTVKGGKHGFVNFLEYYQPTLEQMERFLDDVFGKK